MTQLVLCFPEEAFEMALASAACCSLHARVHKAERLPFPLILKIVNVSHIVMPRDKPTVEEELSKVWREMLGCIEKQSSLAYVCVAFTVNGFTSYITSEWQKCVCVCVCVSDRAVFEFQQ